MLNDFLYRGTVDALKIRFSYAVTTQLASKAILTHNCDPLTAHAFARALTAGILSVPLLGEGERLTYRWNYEGAVKTIVVDFGEDSDVRGFINPTTVSHEAETADELFGESCQLYVVRTSPTQILNSGVIKSIFRDPVDDLCHFYSLSDQVETAMLSMVGFDANPKQPVLLSQGLMIQAMPDCDLEVFDRVRNHLDSEDARQLLKELPEIDNYFETIVRTVVEDEIASPELEVHACPSPAYRCACSPQRMMSALRALPQSDRQDLIDKGEDLVMTCHYCNRQHTIPFSALKEG